jgi:hypothetical protein
VKIINVPMTYMCFSVALLHYILALNKITHATRCLLIYGLFNDAVSSSDYKASKDRMNNELVVTYLKRFPALSRSGLRKITKNITLDSRYTG